MFDSRNIIFLPSLKVMSEDVIVFVNSPVVWIVAIIVSPTRVSSCWKVNVGAADATEIRIRIRKNVVPLFMFD